MSEYTALNDTIKSLGDMLESSDMSQRARPARTAEEQAKIDRIERLVPGSGQGLNNIPSPGTTGSGIISTAEGLQSSAKNILEFNRAVGTGGATAIQGFDRFVSAMEAATKSLISGSQDIRTSTIDTVSKLNQGGPRGEADIRSAFPGLLRQQDLAFKSETLGRAMADAVASARKEYMSAPAGAAGQAIREDVVGRLNASMGNLSSEIFQASQATKAAANFKDDTGGMFDRRGNRLQQPAPEAHNWTRQLSMTIDNVLAAAMMPAIDRYIMGPMQSGMAASQTMPGFLPGASLLSGPFQVMTGYMSQMGRDIQNIEMERKSLLGVTGSSTASQTMIEHAIDIARKEPVEFGTALQAFRAFSVFPGTRQETQNSPAFREELLEVIQRLSILTPEQGEKGAMFAIRELMSGQDISLKRRFNIDLGTLLGSADTGILGEKPKGPVGEQQPATDDRHAKMSKAEFMGLPGSDMIKVLSSAMRRITGESALMERSLTTGVQTNDLRDTLMQAFALPFNKTGMGISLMSGAQEKEYADILFERNKRMTAGSLPDSDLRARASHEAGMAATSPVGAVASGIRGLNDMVGNALAQTGISDTVIGTIKNDIVRPFLDMSKTDSTKDPLDRLLSGIDNVTQGLIKAADSLSSAPAITRVVDTLSNTAIGITGRMVAPAATRGLVMGTASVANSLLKPEALVSTFQQTVQGAMGEGIISPASAVAMSVAGYGGISLTGLLSKRITGVDRIDYDKRRNTFTAFDARGQAVPLTGFWGAMPKLLGPQFHQEWNLPAFAAEAAMTMGGVSSLSKGGNLPTSTVGAIQTIIGAGMMYNSIPQSAKAGYVSLMTPYNDALQQARRNRSDRRVARYTSDASGFFQFDQWGIKMTDEEAERALYRQEASEAASAARRERVSNIGHSMRKALSDSALGRGWQGLTGDFTAAGGWAGQWDRAKSAVSQTGFGRSMINGWQGLTGDFTAAGGWAGQWDRAKSAIASSRIGEMASYGLTWTKANALPVAAGVGAVSLIGYQAYQRQAELEEESKALYSRVSGSSLSEAEKLRYSAPSSQAKVGNIIGAMGTSMMAIGGVAAITGIGAVPAGVLMGVGTAMTIGGSWLQGDAEAKKKRDMESMDVIDSYEREKRLAESMNKDLRTEGDTAKLAQMMGKQISGTEWDRTMDLERQSTLLRQGGSYSVYRKGGKIDTDKFGWGTDQSGGWLSLGTESMDLRRRVALGAKLSDDDKLSMIRLFAGETLPSSISESDIEEGSSGKRAKTADILRGDVATLRSGQELSAESRERLLKNYDQFDIEKEYKRRTKKEFGDITKEMGAGLTQFQSGFGEILTNQEVAKIGGSGVSAEDIAYLVSTRSENGTMNDKYKAVRDTIVQKASGSGVALDPGKVDQFTESLYKMSKGLVEASGGTKSMADATKQTSAASIRAAQDLKDQNYAQMIELMPKIGSMSSSHFVSTGGAGDKYFGVNKNTESLIAEATSMDMSKYMSDPAGFISRMKAVGTNINEYVAERDTKIAQTGGLISSFQDSGGRFKSDWETEGEYQFKRQSLQAQARLGRTGAAEQLQMTDDLDKYLKGINDPSVLIENIRKFSEAGFTVDPEIRKKALAGMVAQGLTRDMKSGVHMMDEVKDKAHSEFGKKIGLEDQYFMPEEYVDLDTAKTALPGFGKDLKSIRLTGIDAPEITSDEKKKVGDLTRKYLKDKDSGALMSGLEGLKRPLAEEIASFIKTEPGDERDKIVSQLMSPSGLQEFAKSDMAARLPLDQRAKLTSLYHHTGMQRMFELQDQYGVDSAYQINGEMDVYGRMLDQKGGKVNAVYKDRLSGELRDDIDIKKQLVSEGWVEGTTPLGALYSPLPSGLLSDKSGRERTPIEAASWRRWNAAIRYQPEILGRGFVRGTYDDSWSMTDTGGFNTGMMARVLSTAYDNVAQMSLSRPSEAELKKQGSTAGYSMYDAASAVENWWRNGDGMTYFRQDSPNRDKFASWMGNAVVQMKQRETEESGGQGLLRSAYDLESDRFMGGLTEGRKIDSWTEAKDRFISGAGLGAIQTGFEETPDRTSEWAVAPQIKEDNKAAALFEKMGLPDIGGPSPVTFEDLIPSAYDTQKSLFADAIKNGGAAPTSWDLAMSQADLGTFVQNAMPKANFNRYWEGNGESIRYDDTTGKWFNEKIPGEPEAAAGETSKESDRLADTTSGTVTAMQSLMDTCSSLNDALNETAARLAVIG